MTSLLAADLYRRPIPTLPARRVESLLPSAIPAPFAASNDTYQVALRLSEQGFHVFPLVENSKLPAIKEWQKLATREPEQIRSWWVDPITGWIKPFNIGICTTRFGDSGALLVVDVDNKGDKKGDEEIVRLKFEGKEFPATRTQRTPTGGAHLVYAVPAAVKQGAGVLGPGLDIRSRGGYIVAAGSALPAGAYTTDDCPIADAPEWLVANCGRTKEPGQREPQVAAAVAPDVALRRAREYLAVLPPAIAGSRNDTGFKVAARLKDEGVQQTQCADIMNEFWKCEPMLDRAELEHVVNSAYEYGRNAIGSAAPEAHFTPVEKQSAPGIIAKRNPLDWAALASRQPPQREWLIDHWLSYDPTLCAGRGGIGKTLIGQQVGSGLAIGRDILGTVPKALRVLMWACEDDHDELWRRQNDIAAYLGVPLQAFQDQLFIEPRRGLDNTLLAPVFGTPKFTPLMDELAAQMNDYRADVLLLDNAGQTYGANENERHPVTMFMNGLAGIGNGRRVATIVLAHPARAKGSEFAGNAAWENAARMRWFMGDVLPDVPQDETAEPDPSVRFLCKRKANYSAQDYRRLIYQNGVLVPDVAPTMESTIERRELATRVVLASLVRLSEIGEYATASSSSPNFLPKQILQYGFGSGYSKKELGEAMRLAMTTGKIKKAVVGEYSNRAKKFGLVVTP